MLLLLFLLWPCITSDHHFKLKTKKKIRVYEVILKFEQRERESHAEYNSRINFFLLVKKSEEDEIYIFARKMFTNM